MENIKHKLILFVSPISHATTQNWIWKKCLSIMTVPCNCCLSLELSVSAALAHIFWTLAEFTEYFSVLISQTNTKYSMPSTAYFCHNWREADCLQATHTFLTIPHYVCINLRYQPFLLKTVSPFLSHKMHILDKLIKHQKAHNFLWFVYEISGMNSQGHPSIWNRSTAENVQCSSCRVRLIIDTAVPNIQQL